MTIILNISLTEFESQLDQILSRVEMGKDISLTRLGEIIIRLSALKKPLKPLAFRAMLPMATPTV